MSTLTRTGNGTYEAAGGRYTAIVENHGGHTAVTIKDRDGESFRGLFDEPRSWVCRCINTLADVERLIGDAMTRDRIPTYDGAQARLF